MDITLFTYIIAYWDTLLGFYVVVVVLHHRITVQQLVMRHFT